MTVVLNGDDFAVGSLFLGSGFRSSGLSSFDGRSSGLCGDFSSLGLCWGLLDGSFLGWSLLGGFGFGFDGACFAGDAGLGQSFLAGKIELTAAAFDDFVQLLTHDG